jgi:hypothetical protein
MQKIRFFKVFLVFSLSFLTESPLKTSTLATIYVIQVRQRFKFLTFYIPEKCSKNMTRKYKTTRQFTIISNDNVYVIVSLIQCKLFKYKFIFILTLVNQNFDTYSGIGFQIRQVKYNWSMKLKKANNRI